MIKGWDEGIVGMCVGEKRKLTVPPELAYGDRGVGDVIPGGATLVFDIELIDLLDVMTPEQAAIAKSSDLAAIKAMVPAEVDPNSVAGRSASPLLSLNIQYHACSDDGHAAIQYLIDQGANVNQENPMVDRLHQIQSVSSVSGHNFTLLY